MRTYAHTIVQLCASTWVWSLAVWAAPLDELRVEHRGTVEIPLLEESPHGPPMVIPEGGSFMVSGQDGSYRFGLQSEDQWRMESRNADGEVKGRYVYQNPEGQMVDISYNAGPQGFIAEGDAIPGGRAPLVDAPIDDQANQFIQATTEVVEEVKGVPYGDFRVSDDLGLQTVVVRADNNLDFGIPYGALAVRGLPGYTPVFPGDNSLRDGILHGALFNTNVQMFENVEAQAIIVLGEDIPYGALRNNNVHILEDVEAQAIIVPGVWPPQLSFNPIPGGFNPIPGGRHDFKDIIYGPALLNGEELKPGFIEA